jgi:hypothetical protein
MTQLDNAVHPFRVNIPEEELVDRRRRIRARPGRRSARNERGPARRLARLLAVRLTSVAENFLSTYPVAPRTDHPARTSHSRYRYASSS